MKVEVLYDPSHQNDDVLTSKWHATLAGLASNILLDTGAQENFISQQFLADHGISYHPLSTSGTVTLGNGSVGKVTGKLTLTLSIRNYHTKVSMYVTDLSEGIHAVLGEPWFRQASAHVEYSPSGMAAVKV